MKERKAKDRPWDAEEASSAQRPPPGRSIFGGSSGSSAWPSQRPMPCDSLLLLLIQLLLLSATPPHPTTQPTRPRHPSSGLAGPTRGGAGGDGRAGRGQGSGGRGEAKGGGHAGEGKRRGRTLLTSLPPASPPSPACPSSFSFLLCPNAGRDEELHLTDGARRSAGPDRPARPYSWMHQWPCTGTAVARR